MRWCWRVTLYEFWRGALARHRRWGESLPLALWRLVGRNRRRYGGYIIHLGVVLMALGVIGIVMFQTETQGIIPQGESADPGRILPSSMIHWPSSIPRMDAMWPAPW